MSNQGDTAVRQAFPACEALLSDARQLLLQGDVAGLAAKIVAARAELDAAPREFALEERVQRVWPHGSDILGLPASELETAVARQRFVWINTFGPLRPDPGDPTLLARQAALYWPLPAAVFRETLLWRRPEGELWALFELAIGDGEHPDPERVKLARAVVLATREAAHGGARRLLLVGVVYRFHAGQEGGQFAWSRDAARVALAQSLLNVARDPICGSRERRAATIGAVLATQLRAGADRDHIEGGVRDTLERVVPTLVRADETRDLVLALTRRPARPDEVERLEDVLAWPEEAARSDARGDEPGALAAPRGTTEKTLYVSEDDDGLRTQGEPAFLRDKGVKRRLTRKRAWADALANLAKGDGDTHVTESGARDASAFLARWGAQARRDASGRLVVYANGGLSLVWGTPTNPPAPAKP